MIKLILSLLLSTSVFAGLPPTTSKVIGDANNLTTFNYLFPFFAGTHTGTSVSLGVLTPAGGGTGTGTVFTTGSVPFAGASGIFAQNNSKFFWDNTNFRLGLGTATPSNDLSFDGQSAKIIRMERNTTANTAGFGLTLQASGATLAATDKAGGGLILSSGIATGTGSSTISFQTATAQGSTNTTDNAPTTKMTILGSGFVGINNTNPAQALSVSSTVSTVSRLTSSAAYSSSTGGARLSLASDTGSALSANSIIGSVGFAANLGGGTIFTGVAIDGVNDNAVWSGSNTGSILNFRTTPVGSTTLATAVVIRGDKSMDVGGTLNAQAAYRGKTSSVSIDTTLATEQFVAVDSTAATRTITLPACVTANLGIVYEVKKTVAVNNVVVTRSSTDLIDGATSFTIYNQYDAKKFVCQSAATWYIY